MARAKAATLESPPSPAARARRSNWFQPALPKIESGVFLPDEAAADEWEGSSTTAGGSDEAAQRLPGPEQALSFPSPTLRLPKLPPPKVAAGGAFLPPFSPPHSVASSGLLYAEPTQTLVFLDWDDTLFACTELFERWGLDRRLDGTASADDDALPQEVERELEKWRVALEDYLSMVCALSDRCVIVTNSSPQWVENCVSRFAPNLLPFFDGTRRGPRVAYAGELLKKVRLAQDSSGCCCPVLWHHLKHALAPMPTPEERMAELTQAKLLAMRGEANSFYSRYPGQTWKNVISIGDMRYERDAVQELSATRVPAVTRERLRTKAIVVPVQPSLSQLTVWLRTMQVLLPAFVRFDGDIDVDLSHTKEPMRALADGLQLPSLAAIVLPARSPSWDEGDRPGLYQLLRESPVRTSPSKGAASRETLQVGQHVDVLETSTCATHLCVWGRIAEPTGWIVLLGRKTGRRWAERQDLAVDEALNEVAMIVQDGLYGQL